MKYTTKLYTITAQTNLHVGSGKQNYGIIDNLVQRDTLTGLPCINGSSLKGALREFFTQQWGKDSDELNFIFGRESTKDDQNNAPGEYRFFDSYLLSLPFRSSHRAFFRTCSPGLLSQLRSALANANLCLNESAENELNYLLQIKEEFPIHFDEEIGNQPEVFLEEFDEELSFKSGATVSSLEAYTGKGLACLDDTKFSSFCDDNHLPVVARNSLEDGRSVNLWYEQILPRQSTFFTLVMIPEREGEENYIKKFDDLLGEQLIQIGANASIGYGFCKMKAKPTQPINAK